MIRTPNILHWRSGILRRTTLLLCILGVLITLVYKHQTQLTESIHYQLQNDNYDSTFESEMNDQPTNSLFNNLDEFLSKNKLKKTKQIKFQSLSRLDQCIVLVNKSIEQFDHMDTNPNDLLFLMTEQLRVYDYCFISGGLYLSSVFNHLEDKSFNPIEYNQRLFPYLNSYAYVDKPMLPNIFQITKNGKQKLIPHTQVNNIQQFNENVWSSMLRHSSLKGIVVTMTQNDIYMFKKLLNVLKFLGNTLPIQIVTTGNDFNEDIITTLSQFVNEYNQEIYLVDCSEIINTTYIHDYITGFLNKWLATLFNSLEEIILIDIDSVPFIKPSEFFDIKQYKESGMYMYRDRDIPKADSPETCVDQFKSLMPSTKEISLNMARFKFQLSKTDTPHHMDSKINEKNELTMEEKTFKDFFQSGNMHQIESGLVIIDRNKQLMGLLMAFLLHMSQRFEKCVHGDKEFFWLGSLITGKDYNIDPINAGTMGMLYETEEHGTGICATQIAHTNEQNNLMWSNGGLNICKFQNAALKDFKINESFFSNRYNDPESLQAIYDSPLQMDGIVIPDVDNSPWMQTRECNQYRFCAYFKETKDISTTTASNSSGRVIRFSPKEVERYNKISNIWSQT